MLHPAVCGPGHLHVNDGFEAGAQPCLARPPVCAELVNQLSPPMASICRGGQRRVDVKVRVTSRRVTAQGNVVAVPKGPQSKHRWWTTCYKAAEQRKQVQDTQIGGSNLELHGNAAGQSQARISAPEPRHETAISPMADCLPSSCRARSRCGDGASLMGGSWRHQSGWACLSAQLLISPAQLSSSRHVTLVT